MIFDSSSDSAEFDGVASTSATFSRFSWRRSSADTWTVSYCTASRANFAPASLYARLARAAIASESSVMKVCWTQPACACCVPSVRVVALAVVRNAFASAAVGAGFEGVCAQPIVVAHALARIKVLIMV